MIQTSILFDYGTEDYRVRIFDQHVDPAAMRIEHRSNFTNNPVKDWTPLSNNRIEILHEGLKADDDMGPEFSYGPSDDQYEELLHAIEESEHHAEHDQEDYIEALEHALQIALELVPGWLEPMVKA